VAQLETPAYRRWTGGKIPYIIDEDYTQSQKSIIEGGMKKIATQVGTNCIQFVPRTTERTYLKIEGKNAGCYSWVIIFEFCGNLIMVV